MVSKVCYRKRYGKGFQYFDENETKIKCVKLLKQIKAMAIPPMWENVEIATSPSAKIQASGRDAKGRKQYIYSEQWQLKQQQKKFAKMTQFAAKLPKMRADCKAQSTALSFTQEHVLATMVRILDETGIRIGNKRYTKENATHGLSTLRRKHVNEENEGLSFRFIGKSNKEREVRIDDEALIKHVIAFSEQPGYNLFRYKDQENKWHDVCSEDINQFIKAQMGEDFSAKDFRTWFASCLAVESYYELEAQFSSSRKSPVNQVINAVASVLGNTVAICRDYYIHPKILSAIENKQMPSIKIELLSEDEDGSALSQLESLTLQLIKKRKR